MCYFKKITHTTVFKLSDRAETTHVLKSGTKLCVTLTHHFFLCCFHTLPPSRLSPEDIDGMIAEANKDGTGLITLQEFVEVIQRTTLFC